MSTRYDMSIAHIALVTSYGLRGCEKLLKTTSKHDIAQWVSFGNCFEHPDHVVVRPKVAESESVVPVPIRDDIAGSGRSAT
jgi:hypothetical protein